MLSLSLSLSNTVRVWGFSQRACFHDDRSPWSSSPSESRRCLIIRVFPNPFPAIACYHVVISHVGSTIPATAARPGKQRPDSHDPSDARNLCGGGRWLLRHLFNAHEDLVMLEELAGSSFFRRNLILSSAGVFYYVEWIPGAIRNVSSCCVMRFLLTWWIHSRSIEEAEWNRIRWWIILLFVSGLMFCGEK